MKNGPPPVEKKEEEVGMDSMTGEGFPQMGHLRRDEMKTPDDVAAMVRLKQLGWGAKRIAAELGCFPQHGKAVADKGRLAPVRLALTLKAA